MASSSRVVDTDNGLRKFFKRLRGFDGLEVVVGITAEQGGVPHPNGELTIAEIGQVHEFGTDKIPQRSFLRATFDANERKYGDMLEKSAARVVKGENPKRGLFVLGETVRADIVDAINNNIGPPLAESTIAAKGSSLPLVDDRFLVNSLRSKVRKETKG